MLKLSKHFLLKNFLPQKDCKSRKCLAFCYCVFDKLTISLSEYDFELDQIVQQNSINHIVIPTTQPVAKVVWCCQTSCGWSVKCSKACTLRWQQVWTELHVQNFLFRIIHILNIQTVLFLLFLLLYTVIFSSTVDREIFVAKKFSTITFND